MWGRRRNSCLSPSVWPMHFIASNTWTTHIIPTYISIFVWIVLLDYYRRQFIQYTVDSKFPPKSIWRPLIRSIIVKHNFIYNCYIIRHIPPNSYLNKTTNRRNFLILNVIRSHQNGEYAIGTNCKCTYIYK